ncbi:MAG TPA: PRC-barrel domain-containing protein [Dehalococcoidia bacterium]|nr:PRC-barrel domain-containing protein [Dehalococcoidia bacterium]
MLREIESFEGYTVNATDGEVGKVKDILFDSQHWTVRHLVVDTGGLIGDHSHLISPYAVTKIDDADKRIDLNLTKQKIKDAPGLEADLPVSRQLEAQYYDYYAWPYYWTGPYSWGTGWVPQLSPNSHVDSVQEELNAHLEAEQDDYLHSFNVANGYTVEARDGAMGDIEDMLMDDESWAIRYVVVDTSKLLPSKDVLISPKSIRDVDFRKSAITLDLTKDELKGKPVFNSIEEARKGDSSDSAILIE